MTTRANRPNLTKRIEIRVDLEDKKKFMANAKGLGIPLSEMILSFLKGVKPPDRSKQNELYVSIEKLTREMNLIGKNINQATLAIHQIKNSDKMETGEFNLFNSLLVEYNIKCNDIRTALDKTLFQ